MAVVNGSALADFIHRNGDGLNPGSLNEINTVTTGADIISGLAGNDVIFGDNGADTISGDDGNDILHGGQGADILTGGVGNDTFRILQISDISGLAENINGGSDVDSLDFQAFNAFGAVDLSLATLTNLENLLLTSNEVTLTSAQLGAFSGIFGTGLTERLILTDSGLVDLSGAVLAALEEIRGNALANTITLAGVVNGQTVNTLGGIDSVTGSAGDDAINGGTGNDSIDGGEGGDTLLGGDGADTMNGEEGNDILTGGQGRDTMTGGIGNDIFRINLVSEIDGLAEVFDGGLDVDILDMRTTPVVGAVNITASTITSVETLWLSGTDLTLSAAQLGGFTTIAGTGFIDRLILAAGGTANLTGATITGIEEIRGSSSANIINLTDVIDAQFIDGRGGSDTITGTLGTDTINGGDGDDTIDGSAGADVIRGGTGADTLIGSSGNDTFQITGVSDISGLIEVIDGGNDTDTLDFAISGAFGLVDLTTTTLTSIETLRLFGNTVTMTAAQMGSFQNFAGSGNSEILKLSAAGSVNLSNTTINAIDEFHGTVGSDSFNFGNANGGFTIFTFEGDDTVTGGNGNDTITGGDGADTLLGRDGNDIITGGLGRDVMTGGLGVDVFDFNDGPESVIGALRDVITDFVHGQDIVNLADMDANSEAVGNQPFAFIGASAFTNVAGQLRYAAGRLEADFNGDGVADFQIGLSGTPPITVTDIIL